MRLPILLVVLALAGMAAASADATVRPLRPGDAALLNRTPTPEERVAESVAKRLTRLSPAVRCGALYFLLLPEICNYLTWFRAAPENYDPGTCQYSTCFQLASSAAFALATVSHESYHVLGYRLEKQVECYGMQSIWYVATSLGASVAEGQRIAAYYWRTTYARREYSTPTYWSADCRDGGKYDLRPASHAWPS